MEFETISPAKETSELVAMLGLFVDRETDRDELLLGQHEYTCVEEPCYGEPDEAMIEAAIDAGFTVYERPREEYLGEEVRSLTVAELQDGEETLLMRRVSINLGGDNWLVSYSVARGVLATI